jgi:hypothetical protein
MGSIIGNVTIISYKCFTIVSWKQKHFVLTESIKETNSKMQNIQTLKTLLLNLVFEKNIDWRKQEVKTLLRPSL